MATVTGLTADRMLAIEAASIVDGDIVGDDLILTRQSGSTINAGSVRGAQGVAGPAGSDLAVLASKSILDIGLLNQIRAGRQLTATDFTDMGLPAPTGLWNLSNVADSSGNGRSLTNRNAVTFDIGINGLATTAAKFSGSTTQGLYIVDTGGADPFKLRTLSVGCWYRSAKRGIDQVLVSKFGADGNSAYSLQVSALNLAVLVLTANGTYAGIKSALSLTDICDDRWHFVVGTFDGAVGRIYVDGLYENHTVLGGRIFAANAPFNIGSYGLDASAAGVAPNFGLIDEAFVTDAVLSEDQIRNLYCAKIAHTFGAIPKRSSINVRRLRKGAALLTTDFPTTPLRLYNFSAGSVNNEGSDANGAAGSTATLQNNSGAAAVTGVDGLFNNAYNFNGATQSLSATDTGLPSGTNSWSFGQWFKTVSIGTDMALGCFGSAYGLLHWIQTSGILVSRNVNAPDDITGPFVIDGEWHFIVTTAHNTPVDGVKRKFYVDGKLIGGSTILNSVALLGAHGFRVGAGLTGSLPFIGQIDTAFVCNYVLTADQIMTLYIKGTQALGVSPKNPGDHIEQITATDLFCVFDTLEMQHQIDLAVG